MTDAEYQDIRESFALAMHSAGIDEDVIEAVCLTVDDAVDNNMEPEPEARKVNSHEHGDISPH